MQRALIWFDSAVWAISIGVASISALLLLFVFIIIQYEVVMRFVFNAPTDWTNEVSTFVISWVGFLGAGYVLRLGRQLEIDVITMRLSAKSHRILGTSSDIGGAIFSAYTAYLGYEFVRVAWLMNATSASELDTPLWIPYLTIPIGFGVLALEFVTRIFWRWGVVERRQAAHVTTG
jgi:TRAP-type C4-dicarboxylate transport system permease small subunit